MIKPHKQTTSFWSDRNQWLTSITLVSQERSDNGPFDFGENYGKGSLERVINSLLLIRDSIPEEYRADAYCAIDSASGYEGDHWPSIEIGYKRPATDDEIRCAKAAIEQRKQEELVNARQKYEALKRRFEPGEQ